MYEEDTGALLVLILILISVCDCQSSALSLDCIVVVFMFLCLLDMVFNVWITICWLICILISPLSSM